MAKQSKTLRNRRRRRGKPVDTPSRTTRPTKAPTRLTTRNDGHTHRWKPRNQFTSFSNGHRHRINFNTRTTLPIRIGGHTHRLR